MFHEFVLVVFLGDLLSLRAHLQYLICSKWWDPANLALLLSESFTSKSHNSIPTTQFQHLLRSIHILETSGRKIFSKLLQEYTYNSHSTSNQKLLDLVKQYGINISLSSVKSLTDEGAV
jgi:hypothetical protein